MRKELKKHIKQMNAQEIMTVVNMVESSKKNIDPVTLDVSDHCLDMMKKRLGVVNKNVLLDVLAHYEVVEYKQVFDGHYMIDKRVVLRSSKAYDNYNYCVVFSVMRNSIITYWKNKTYNTHKNVDLTKYTTNMKVY